MPPTTRFVTITHPELGTARVHPVSAQKIYVPRGWTVQAEPAAAASAQQQDAGDDDEEAPRRTAAPAKQAAPAKKTAPARKSAPVKKAPARKSSAR